MSELEKNIDNKIEACWDNCVCADPEYMPPYSQNTCPECGKDLYESGANGLQG